jgi:hypothetical protein
MLPHCVSFFVESFLSISLLKQLREAMGVEVNDARQEWRSDGMPFTGFEGSPESVADAALAQRELGPAGHDYKRCATDAAEGEDIDLALVKN